jgi:hypothetical protein
MDIKDADIHFKLKTYHAWGCSKSDAIERYVKDIESLCGSQSFLWKSKQRLKILPIIDKIWGDDFSAQTEYDLQWFLKHNQ